MPFAGDLKNAVFEQPRRESNKEKIFSHVAPPALRDALQPAAAMKDFYFALLARLRRPSHCSVLLKSCPDTCLSGKLILPVVLQAISESKA